MTNIPERLITAAELIEATGWCRGAMARDSASRAVKWSNPDACCYCIVGAIKRTAPSPEDACRALAALSGMMDMRMDYYNDRHLRSQLAAASFLRDMAASFGPKRNGRRLSKPSRIKTVDATGGGHHTLCL